MDGEACDCGHCFEEGPDKVLAFGEERVAESLQDEWGEVGEAHLGDGQVRHEFIGVRLFVHQMSDSHVPLADRRDNTQVDLEVQPLRVDVVRFAEVGVVHLAHDEDVVTVINNVIVV